MIRDRRIGNGERPQRGQGAMVARVSIARMRAVIRMPGTMVRVARVVMRRGDDWKRDPIDLADIGDGNTTHLRRTGREQGHAGSKNQRERCSPEGHLPQA